MPEPDHVELQNIINDKEARIKELEEEIKANEATISTLNALTQEHQCKIDELKRNIDELKNEKDQLKERINDLEEEVKKLNIWNGEKDSRYNGLEKEFKNNAKRHENEMKQLRKENSQKLESLKARTSKKIRNLAKQREDELQRNQDLEKERDSLEEDKKNLTSEMKNHSLDYCYLCIGQVCSKLQGNMYHYVLPDLYGGEEWPYKVRHIKEDIEREYKYDNEKKQQSLARLKTLEETIQWEGKYEGVIDLLQSKRNQVAHPSIPNVETAQKAAQELHDQDKLKGKICHGRVLRIINMLELSAQLLKRSKLM